MFEVNKLKPFPCLAFPQTAYLKTLRKQPILGHELVTSFGRMNLSKLYLCEMTLGTNPDITGYAYTTR